MTDDLAERMRRSRTEDLLLMARARPEDGIVEEAMLAAQAELASRDLPAEELEELTSDLENWQTHEATAGTRHLSGPAVIFFGLSSFMLVGVFAFRVLRARGHYQMATDALAATAIGYALTLGVLALLFMLFG